MKKLYFSALVVAAFTLQSVFANTEGNPTIKEQLDNLNSCWKTKNFDDPILKEKILLKDEVVLIQMHLSLVEQKLREKNTGWLNADQKQNRAEALDLLHNYCARGLFPKNLYHKKRTPYFIDDFGTACAVGQLIIATGYSSLAKKIAAGNNYSYIKELNQLYPELKQWADKFGFAIDELAWIQPGYPICDTACTQELHMIASGGTPPYTYLWNPTGQTTKDAINLCPATTYTCTVIDAMGDTVPDFNCMIVLGLQGYAGNTITIPAATPVYITLSSTGDNGSCNGTATATVTSGAFPYWYNWQPGGQGTHTATGLCGGTYSVLVEDANGCLRADSVTVISSVGINEINYNSFVSAFPDPFIDEISIAFQKQNIKQVNVSMKNIFGQTVFNTCQSNLTNKPAEITGLGFLSKGIYLVDIVIDGERTVKKIVKD